LYQDKSANPGWKCFDERSNSCPWHESNYKKQIAQLRVDDEQGCQTVCVQTKNPTLRKCWEGLAMANLGIFYDHLVYFTASGNNLWQFGIFCGHLVISPRFGILYQEKSGNPVDEHIRKRICITKWSSYVQKN
jgi:hypothetical protein